MAPCHVSSSPTGMGARVWAHDDDVFGGFIWDLGLDVLVDVRVFAYEGTTLDTCFDQALCVGISHYTERGDNDGVG